MRCPHCSTVVNIDFNTGFIGDDPGCQEYGYAVAYGTCPACKEPIVTLRRGLTEIVTDFDMPDYAYTRLGDIEQEEVIYPRHATRAVESEVPDKYRREFLEAYSVLQLSPKASAALGRRLLQRILREEFNITQGSLAKEIELFIQMKDVPVYLSDAIDAVRSIGNFAAHPLKNSNTGEIAEVEPGEAEWLLEVLEFLFDFTFVQPRRLKERKQKLNAKLQALGKPPMKD